MIQGMTIEPITKKQAERFVLEKHYSHRASIFWHGFGLIESGYIVGVVVYGQPSAAVQKHAFVDRDFLFMELSRLVIQTSARNAASTLIAGSLALLPSPSAVVSYADTEHNHCGIVYQATNWLYTGATKSHDHAYVVDGKRVHPMTLRDRGITNPKQWARENGIETIAPMLKHRYFFFNGNRTEKRGMRAKLKYPILRPYPKMNQERYDDGPEIIVAVRGAT